MNYRKIDQRVQKLTPSEAFAYFCLAVKSDYNTYESHIKQKNLLIFMEEKGLKVTEKTLRNYLNKFEEVGLLEKDTKPHMGKSGYFIRNTYKLSTEHYELIDAKLLDLEVSAKTKGFLIILWLTAYNHRQYIALTNAQIVERTELGKNAIPTFIKEATKAGILEKKKPKVGREETHFTDKEIFILTPETDAAMARNIYPEAFDDGFN